MTVHPNMGTPNNPDELRTDSAEMLLRILVIIRQIPHVEKALGSGCVASPRATMEPQPGALSRLITAI